MVRSALTQLSLVGCILAWCNKQGKVLYFIGPQFQDNLLWFAETWAQIQLVAFFSCFFCIYFKLFRYLKGIFFMSKLLYKWYPLDTKSTWDTCHQPCDCQIFIYKIVRRQILRKIAIYSSKICNIYTSTLQMRVKLTKY